MGYAYNRDICGEKDWAAVRREERRELPQPVVIVRNLYGGRFEQVQKSIINFFHQPRRSSQSMAFGARKPVLAQERSGD